MVNNQTGLEGSHVIVVQPEQLRAPYDKKVVNRVGWVERTHNPKAGSRPNAIATVRFPSIWDGDRITREFKVPVRMDNLKVVPEDYVPPVSNDPPAPTGLSVGADPQHLRAIEYERDRYRQQTYHLRQQIAALKAKLDLTHAYKSGKAQVWRGDGTDDLASMDHNAAMLIAAGELANLVRLPAPPLSTDAEPEPPVIDDQFDYRFDDSLQDRLTAAQLAGVIARQYADKSDDFVLSVGHWEPDQLVPSQLEFHAFLAVPMRDWRAYARSQGQGDNASDEPTAIEPGMTVRLKNLEKYYFDFARRVVGRDGQVIWVGGTPGNPRPGKANIRFGKRNGRGKEFEQVVRIRDLEVVAPAPVTGSTSNATPAAEQPFTTAGRHHDE